MRTSHSLGAGIPRAFHFGTSWRSNRLQCWLSPSLSRQPPFHPCAQPFKDSRAGSERQEKDTHQGRPSPTDDERRFAHDGVKVACDSSSNHPTHPAASATGLLGQ